MKLFKSIRNCTIVAAAFLLGMATACAKSDSVPVSKEIKASGFESVRVANQFNVTITTGADFKVVATVPEKMVEYLDIAVENDRLVVKLKKNSPRYKGTLECAISMPKLAKLNAAEQSTVKVEGGKYASDLVVKASGQSDVDFDGTVNVNTLSLTAGGQSLLKMDNSTSKNLSVTASSQSVVKLENVTTGEGSLIAEGQSVLKVAGCTASKMSSSASGQSVMVVKGLDCADFSQSKAGQSTLKVERK